jgi:hypothetical protein
MNLLLKTVHHGGQFLSLTSENGRLSEREVPEVKARWM